MTQKIAKVDLDRIVKITAMKQNTEKNDKK